jgi:hypothetical protein
METSKVLRDFPFSEDQPLKPAADRHVQRICGKEIDEINKARRMDAVIG